jgi:hypothetical protein
MCLALFLAWEVAFGKDGLMKFAYLLFLAPAVLMPTGAQASTVLVGYLADPLSNYVVSGGGTFTTNTDGTVGISNLSSFNYSYTFTDRIYHPVFKFDLSNITSFSATIASGLISSLSFTTNNVFPIPNDASYVGEHLKVGSLGLNDTLILVDGNFQVSRGTTTAVVTSASAGPEPATWAMLLLGFGIIGFAMRKRLDVLTRVSYD